MVFFSLSIVIFVWVYDLIVVIFDVKLMCISDGEEGCKRSKDDESKIQIFYECYYGFEKWLDERFKNRVLWVCL